MFTIGSSSSEDEGSYSSRMFQPEALRSSAILKSNSNGPSTKPTSFKDELAAGRAASHRLVLGSSDEDEEVSSDVIEDDSSDWEDPESDEGGPSDLHNEAMFQRVNSTPDLVSRRSLLTSMLEDAKDKHPTISPSTVDESESINR